MDTLPLRPCLPREEQAYCWKKQQTLKPCDLKLDPDSTARKSWETSRGGIKSLTRSGGECNSQHFNADSEGISHLQQAIRACAVAGVRIIINRAPRFSARRCKLISRWHPKELSLLMAHSRTGQGMESLWHKPGSQSSPRDKRHFLMLKTWLQEKTIQMQPCLNGEQQGTDDPAIYSCLCGLENKNNQIMNALDWGSLPSNLLFPCKLEVHR